ncbi:MAG: DinB family protein, partial [Actinobacteria bacterium]|nr:DinB family protein [Actinomycetota bacterium]
ERVDGEWSYLQTLRHLVMATDRWIVAPVLGETDPYHRLGWPNDPHDEVPPGLFLLDARPSLDDVLAIRRDRMDRVGAVLAEVDAEELARVVPGPYGGTTTVLRCVHVVLREEWWHDRYATRDLAILAERHADP